jgi:hypothetical protein
VRPSHGRPRGHRPIVRSSVCPSDNVCMTTLPATQHLPSPNFMEAPLSSVQILVSSGQSNEIPTTITKGLQQMESLTLQQGTGSADVSREHTPVHAEA